MEGVIGTSLTDEEAGAFDIEELVGMTCQVTVVHKKSADGEKTYANIASVAPLMKGIEVPDAINKPIIQDVNVMSDEEIDELPEFLQVKMRESDEWKARFDPDEIARKQSIQDEINKRTGGSNSNSEQLSKEEIEDSVPF